MGSNLRDPSTFFFRARFVPVGTHGLNHIYPPGLVYCSLGLVLVQFPGRLRLKIKGKNSSKG